ncbi:hypothetical protein COLO4_16981 [Corchorus olitorius]|uniref:Uncharacterized protein n=1 Tax=Corchorus olitorius TaxID=93759 RepID=A0A1R3JEN5_9ROSI|nr:hypothetical protein COLO4_16981 [Corchorus olitorius]
MAIERFGTISQMFNIASSSSRKHLLEISERMH